MEHTTNRSFGISSHVMSVLHHIVLFAMLHATFVAPAQGIIDAFMHKHAHNWGSGISHSFNNEAETSNAASGKIEIGPRADHYSRGEKSNAPAMPTSYSVGADISEGTIGASTEKPFDSPTDNLFKINLSELPLEGSKVYLVYEVNGVAGSQSVAKSINERLSVGGHMVRLQQGWTIQKEELDPKWLKPGQNTVLFTIPEGADYHYKVRNIALRVEKGQQASILTVENSLMAKDDKIYIKGFIRGSHPKAKVEAGGMMLPVHNGEFEGYINLNEEIGRTKLIAVRATEGSELLGQEILFADSMLHADKLYPIAAKNSAVSGQFRSCSYSTVSTVGATVATGSDGVANDYEVSITRLRAIDIASLSSGMINVTKGGNGYRFLPDGAKFDSPVNIAIAYDPKLIPTGYTEKDVRTYFFDTQSKQWTAVHRDSIDVGNQSIVSKTTHFTDYINGIIQAPESPESNAFAPTMMSDIKAADPSSEMTLISPPSASQSGSAGLSYPIKIPGGRRGLQPQVGLQYSNDGPNGWVGLGWALNAPSLTIDTRWGIPVFNQGVESELYSLNGEQLMYPDGYLPHRHQDGPGGTLTTVMQPRNASGSKLFYPRKQGSFDRIERLGNSPQTYYWKVTNTDGTTSWYGGKTASDIQNGAALLRDHENRIVHWALFMVEDIYGNTMRYTYEKYSNSNTLSNLLQGQQIYLSNINYTGYGNDPGNYDVKFLRKTTRPDVMINARLGIKQVDAHLLSDIEVYYLGKVIRRYHLNYKTGRFDKSLLEYISESDQAGMEFYRHDFQYYDDIRQADNTDSYFSAEIEERLCIELPPGETPETDTDNDGVPDSRDQCVTEPGPASNNGCPEENPGGSTGNDPNAGRKYCYELTIKLPLANKRYSYRLGTQLGDVGCVYRPMRLHSISFNGLTHLAPSNLYLSHYAAGNLINLCPAYPVTADFENPDPVIQNSNFTSQCKSWFENSLLAPYLDAGSNLTLSNRSGVYLWGGNVMMEQRFMALFESSADLSQGAVNTTTTWNGVESLSGVQALAFQRRIISANGVATVVTIDGTSLSPSPFNLHDDFASFKSAVEALYGGTVTMDSTLDSYYVPNAFSESTAVIKFHDVSMPLSTLKVGGIEYLMGTCKNPDAPGHRQAATEDVLSSSRRFANPNNYTVDFEATVPIGDPGCPSLLNLDFLIQGNMPSYNSAASLLGSSKTSGYSFGGSLGFGIGCKMNTKSTTLGGQLNFGYDKSSSFSAMIDIDGDGLEDVLIKNNNGMMYYSKHAVNRTYNSNGQLQITHSFMPYVPITGVNNFYKGNGSTTTKNMQITFGFSKIGGFAGLDWSDTKGETNVYMTDANGDGLPDIVKNGTVFFNRIKNGRPEFVPDSEGSPNLVIKAAPRDVQVPDEYYEQDIEIPNYDVVKVWEAPYHGQIRITNDIVLQDLDQEVTVTIEGRAKDTLSGLSCLMYGNILNSANPEVHEVLYDAGNCHHNSPPGSIGVNHGQLIFFRVHSNKAGSNPRVDWDPMVEYISYPVGTDLDQNGLDPYAYRYSDAFMLTQKEGPAVFPGTGTATIDWDAITVNAPSDDIVFEIYQAEESTTANGNFENGSSTNSQLIYKRFCPAGAVTAVSPSLNDISGVLSNIQIASNDTPGASNTSTIFYFKVRSDSNVNWKAIEWKPELQCALTETVIGADGTNEGTLTTTETILPLVDMSIYKVYNREWPTYSPINGYAKQNYPVSSGLVQSRYAMPHLSGIFQSGDSGDIWFIVKKGGLPIGKRHIHVNNSSFSFDINTPIDLGPNSNEDLEFGFYSDDSRLPNSGVSLLERLYLKGNNVVRVAEDNWNYGAVHFLTDHQVNLFHIPMQKFGPMHRQWGQFAYNPDAVEIATVTDKYGRLINPSVLLEDPDASSIQAAIADIEAAGENVTVEQLEVFETQYSGLYSKSPFFTMYPKREQVGAELVERWYGTCAQNYASAYSYRAAAMDEIADEFVDNDDYVVQEVLETGAYGITKYTKGKSRNAALGVSIDVAPGIGAGASGSKSLNAYNNSLTDYVDLNGDRYPDILNTNEVQYTLSTGGLKYKEVMKSNLDGTSGAQISTSINENWGVQASGSFTAGEKSNNNVNGIISEFRFIGFKGNAGAGLSGNFSKGKSESRRMWSDINGDGLADILEKNNNNEVVVRLNIGNNIYLPMQVNASSWGISQVFDSKSHNYGGGIGINKWNGSYEFGISLGSGRNDVINVLNDINGDGIADYIHSSENGLIIRVNDGSGFAPAQMWTDWKMNYEAETSTSSKNGGMTLAIVFPIPFFSTCLKIAGNINGTDYESTNRTKKSISDFDGDGFPDLISEDNNNTLRVRYSNIRRTNMLKSVDNPLGGKFTVDYKVVTPTYNNPDAKWVMSSVKIEDGYNLAGDGADMYLKSFEYESAYYDRRERESYGFETVKTIDHTFDQDGKPDGIYRTNVSVFHNKSYYLRGLERWSYLIKGSDEAQVFSRTISNYALRKLDASGLIMVSQAPLPYGFDTGGSEGRKSAAVVLQSTETHIFELGSSPLINRVEFIYDERGRVTTYKYKGNPTVSADDYTADVSYYTNVALADKNIYNVPQTIEVRDASNVLKRSRVVGSVDNNTGDVTMIGTQLDNSTWAETAMLYDPYGNLQEITYPYDDNGDRFKYTYTYDPVNHKAVTQVQDSYGYLSGTEYDFRFDKVIKATDITGNFVNYTYDSFGRMLTIQAPKEIANNIPYTIAFKYYPKLGDLESSPDSCLGEEKFMPVAITSHYDEFHPGNDLQTYTFIDGMARAVQVKKDIELNRKENASPELVERMSVSGRVSYDVYGRAERQYHPYYEDKGCNPNIVVNQYVDHYFSETHYDEANRPVLSIDPEGNTSTVLYELGSDASSVPALKTRSVTDQNGSAFVITETYKDVNGRTTSTKNVLTGQGDIWTKFEYDALGQLLAYTDAQDIATQYTYDLGGRKTKLVHPDNGTTEYLYDPAGNLIKLQTANLASDQTLQPADRFIKYIYDFNRLVQIRYPDMPNGSNISNVEYQYGAIGNNAGKVIYQVDATGEQQISYGNMGEMIKNVRLVVGPNIPNRNFTTLFEYDSWNRVKQITYPDGENVTYNYNLGGNLTKVSGDLNGSPYDYVARIDYDYFEQRSYLLYGNGTDMSYSYTETLRRLDIMQARTSAQHKFMDNVYSYDKVGNITTLVNSAAVNSSNLMGGGYSHNYLYDNMNRLKSGNGSFTGDSQQQYYNNDYQAAYNVALSYNTTHGIEKKAQNHELNGQTVAANTYDNVYSYYEGTHQVQNIYDQQSSVTESFKYDKNGNVTSIHNTNTGVNKVHYWDESNRLRVISDDQQMQHYIYDATGERVLKATAQPESVYENGMPTSSTVTFDTYTTYPNPYIVITGDGKFSKHYYAGSQRVVSRLSDQSAEIFEKGNRAAESTPTKNKEAFSEDKLRNLQISDLTIILAKKNKSLPAFKKYKPNEKEVIDDDTPEKSNNRSDGFVAKGPPVGLYFYHPDHLGTSTFLTDANGELYQFFLNLPFGETMAGQHSQTEDYETPFKFNGKELDAETGLYYYGARYYDPRASIWLSTDPLMEMYPGFNPYVYCFQNPVNIVDPTGMAGVDANDDIDPPTKRRMMVFAAAEALRKESGLYNLQGNSPEMFFDLPDLTIEGRVSVAKKAANAAVVVTAAAESGSGSGFLRILANVGLRASVVIGSAMLLEGDEPVDRNVYFYRAMSMNEYNSTGGYLQDRNTSGEGPKIREDFSYINNADFINKPNSKYDVVVQYKVSIESATLIKATPLIYVPGSGPGSPVFNAARKSGMPYQKIEKGVSYGFPGAAATALFNSMLLDKPKIFSTIKK